MHIILIYLLVVNIITFVFFAVDARRYRMGEPSPEPEILYDLLTIFGGALGIVLGFFIIDRGVRKRHMMWFVFAATLLIVQALIVFILFGPYQQEILQYFMELWYDSKMTVIIAAYLVIINFITYEVYKIDKKKAERHEWRIRESKLIGLALIGGSAGGWISMKSNNHKTNTPAFRKGIPMIMIAQIAVIVVLHAAGII